MRRRGAGHCLEAASRERLAAQRQGAIDHARVCSISAAPSTS
jgi:hypothetical protein